MVTVRDALGPAKKATVLILALSLRSQTLRQGSPHMNRTSHRAIGGLQRCRKLGQHLLRARPKLPVRGPLGAPKLFLSAESS